tara:strand:- start:103 stop:231 length:129 start_codon:yes stop_codon:yes gene_type:complete
MKKAVYFRQALGRFLLFVPREVDASRLCSIMNTFFSAIVAND